MDVFLGGGDAADHDGEFALVGGVVDACGDEGAGRAESEAGHEAAEVRREREGEGLPGRGGEVEGLNRRAVGEEGEGEGFWGAERGVGGAFNMDEALGTGGEDENGISF